MLIFRRCFYVFTEDVGFFVILIPFLSHSADLPNSKFHLNQSPNNLAPLIQSLIFLGSFWAESAAPPIHGAPGPGGPGGRRGAEHPDGRLLSLRRSARRHAALGRHGAGRANFFDGPWAAMEMERIHGWWFAGELG